MSQNTSSAVMQQRSEPNDSLDFFPTPPWAVRALCKHVLPRLIGHGQSLHRVLEPACGQGHMARALAEFAQEVIAADVHDYGFGEVDDFLFAGSPWINIDWVITNPPFRLAREFIYRGLEIASEGVAMLVRTSFLEGIERHETLYRPYPPAIVAQFVERVPMVKGRVDKNASTATSYCWIVFIKDYSGPTTMVWIPRCRAQLEKQGDYT